MGLSHSPRIVTNGLVLCLDAANPRSYPGSGTTWTDLSGNGNNGTLQGSPTYTSTGPQSFAFNAASSQYVSTTLPISNPAPGSIGVWFKTSIASGRKIIGLENAQTGTAASEYDRHIYMGSDGKIYGGIYENGFKIVISSNTLNDNNWHYALITYSSGNNLILYIDGIFQQSTALGTIYNYSTTPYWRLASYGSSSEFWTNATNGYWTGSIGTAQIYNRALSAAEIRQNFNATRGRYGI